MEERLKQIKARCNALGWDWDKFQKAAVELHVAMGGIYEQDDWYLTAERVLSLHEDGPMVELSEHFEGTCSPVCYFLNSALHKCYLVNGKLWHRYDKMGYDVFTRHQDCPAPGTFKIVRWGDE